MVCRLALVLSFVAVLSGACGTVPAPAEPPPAATAASPAAPPRPADQDQEKADAKLAARKQKQKELRGKQRELEAAHGEQQVAEFERRMRQLALDASVQKTTDDLEQAKQDLAVFLADQKPRELEERRISFDSSTYRAEHSKDELGELVAMYEADEFARTTKELVLKRGRRDLELAERSLAVATKELAHFEQVTLPQRERELQQKLRDAERERTKVGLEVEKWQLEGKLAEQKHKDRLADLAEDIQELQAALAKESP
ncbi:MAG: hypothetical protein MUC36_04570 [Planctomycetes bacterium]|jgi:hypothetical protein|nr:hypothetical protein [Planctomycetota bacterium]